jgi:hypothetical protein
MICQLELDVSDKKEQFARDFFNSISFVKNVVILKENEITNPKISKRIENYEAGNSELVPVSLDGLGKKLANA